MIEDKDTLYNIDEESVGEYVLEDDFDGAVDADDVDESAEGEGKTARKRKPSPMAVMFKTMFGPVEGWKALKRARFTTERLAAGCFYPLLAIAAASQAAMFIYEANMTATDFVKAGLTTFVSFFFGYFSVLFFGEALLPRSARKVLKTEIGKQFVMLAMSTLILFETLNTLLPMLDYALFFLPLWTFYLIFKGVRILRVPKETEPKVIGLMCMLIIGLPLFWDWVMTEVLLKYAGI